MFLKKDFQNFRMLMFLYALVTSVLGAILVFIFREVAFTKIKGECRLCDPEELLVIYSDVNTTIITGMLLGAGIAFSLTYLISRFGFLGTAGKDLCDFCEIFTNQEKVNEVLTHLAQDFHSGCKKENEINQKILALDGKSGGSSLYEKERAVKEDVQLWKNNLWRAHRLAKRMGYQVQKTHKAYLV